MFFKILKLTQLAVYRGLKFPASDSEYLPGFSMLP